MKTFLVTCRISLCPDRFSMVVEAESEDEVRENTDAIFEMLNKRLFAPVYHNKASVEISEVFSFSITKTESGDSQIRLNNTGEHNE